MPADAASGLAAHAVATLAALALFLAPGALVLRAARALPRDASAPAHAFAASLAVLLVAHAVLLAAGASISAAFFAVPACTAVAAALARLLAPPRGDEAARPGATPPQTPGRAAAAALALVAVATLVAAVAYAPRGSVDRWWYLAYVSTWADAPALDLAEPFLGSGLEFARFGLHPWLFGLALLAHAFPALGAAGVYETAGAVVAVVAALSASWSLSSALFAGAASRTLSTLATVLLWTGAVVPLAARAAEDKVLAAAALLPLVAAAFLDAVGGRGDAGGAPPEAHASSRAPAMLRLAFAAMAGAAVHALVHAFALAGLAAAAVLLAWRHPARRGAVASAMLLLAVVSGGPALEGRSVSARLDDIGARPDAADHPVVRVHDARERLVELPGGQWAASPRLLAHPLAMLALGVLVVPAWRRRARASLDAPAAAWVAGASAVALGVAFVPPLPALAATVIPSWMVYRVLWLLPLGPLAAIAATALTQRPGSEAGRPGSARETPSGAMRPTLAALLLLLLGLPAMVGSAADRLGERRARRDDPDSAEFAMLVEAMAALPRDAVVAAPAELAERIPGLCARRVLAGLDRSTVVFAGSRDAGEARLRARAATLLGDDDAGRLSVAAGSVPTHAVYDPRSPFLPACSETLAGGEALALCSLDGQVVATAVPAQAPTVMARVDEGGGEVLATGSCTGDTPRRNHDPWSAAPPAARCRVPVPAGAAGRRDLAVRVVLATGRAVDEARVDAWTVGVHGRGSARVHSGEAATFVLPAPARDSVEVRVASMFLPTIAVREVALVAVAAGR